MKDAWERLAETVSHMHARLAEPGAIFRDSLVNNTRELVDVLARLNVTGDVQLEAFRSQVSMELCAIDAQGLRDDPNARQDVATKAQAIMDAMAGFYGNGGTP
jgi:hypothetical protein